MSRPGIEFVATIESLTRLSNSRNGNPRYRIHFVGGTTAVTQADSSIVYAIGNPEYRGVPVRVEATPAGRVWNVTPVSEES